MKPVTMNLTVTFHADALVDLLTQAIERGTGRCTQALARGTERQQVDVNPAPKPRMNPLEASQHALFGGQKPPDDMGLLIDTRQACKLLGVSPRKLWEMYNSGQMPQPIRIGRAVRWSYEEVRAWVNAGCPKLDEWNWSR